MSLPVVKTPTDFPFTHTGQPDKLGQSLGGDFADVQDKFDSRAIFNQTQINAIISALKSVADGDSGADCVKATSITDLTGDTVQSLLESLKTYTDLELQNVVLGQIPDNSLTNDKLATDVKIGSLSDSNTIDKSSVIAITNEILNLTQAYKSVKNLVINGNFQVNQLSKTGTVTLSSGEYGHDMWKAGSSGCTYTFSTTNNVATITISSGSLVQVIDGKNILSGVYSLWWSGTSQAKINSTAFSASGISDTLTGGTNATIEFSTGTLSLVRLISGTVDSNYTFENYDDELRKCQYYLYPLNRGSSYRFTSRAMSVATSFMFFTCDSQNIMRINPTPVFGTEGTDWEIAQFPSGAPQTGFSLTYTHVGNGYVTIRADKTSHGLSDAMIVFKTNKSYLDARL